MNIVELSNASRYESESSGPTTWVGRTFGKASPSGLATLLLICGFVLVAASQWFPLVRSVVDPSKFDADAFGQPMATANIADAQFVLQIPYYLIWLVVFVLLGALVFAPGARRPVLFGAGAGALAVQALLVLPILRRPVLLVNGSPDETGITVHFQIGTVFLIASFVVLAAAMVVAVRGRVLPAADAHIVDTDRAPVPPEAVVPRPSMHDAIAEAATGRGEGDADIEFGWSSRRAEVVDVSELDEPVNQTPPRDHDIYRRPADHPVG